MAKSTAGLTRKKVSVRMKNGKTIQRSMMVASNKPNKKGRRTLKSGGGSGAGHSAKLGAMGGFAQGVLGGHRLMGAGRSMLAGQAAAHGVAHQLHGKKKGAVRRHLATALAHFAGHAVGNIAHEGLRRAVGAKSSLGGRGGYG